MFGGVVHFLYEDVTNGKLSVISSLLCALSCFSMWALTRTCAQDWDRQCPGSKPMRIQDPKLLTNQRAGSTTRTCARGLGEPRGPTGAAAPLVPQGCTSLDAPAPEINCIALHFDLELWWERTNSYRWVPIASPAIAGRPRESEKEGGEVKVCSGHLGQVDRTCRCHWEGQRVRVHLGWGD